MNKLFTYKRLFPVFFFAAAFLYLLRPVGAEQDFWWHLSTGRWIWEHGGLPDTDPFSLFASSHPDRFELIILKGYWLSQIIYYLLHQVGGLTAICILGALTMLATVFWVWRILIMQNIPVHISLMVLAPLVATLGVFSEHRPQQFSFLFFSLLFYLLERTIYNLYQKGDLGIPAYLVPLVVAVWAQMHPGYAIAFPLLFIYLIAAFTIQEKKTNHPSTGGAFARSPVSKFLLLIAASILATIAAPNGPAALVSIFSTAYDFFLNNSADTFAFTPVDHTRPWKISDHWYWRLLLSSLIAVLISCCACYKSIPKHYIIAAALYAVLSLVAYRFGTFFFISGAVVTGHFSLVLIRKLHPRTALVTCSLVTLGLMVPLLVSASRKGLSAQGNFTPSLVSDHAVSFLLASNIPGTVANPYSWGGYLMWHIWPHYKIFCDQRGLKNSGGERSSDLMFMENTVILDQLGINAVVINIMDPVVASVYYGFITLMESDTWDLAYYDDISAIFVRSGHLPALKKADLEHAMTTALMRWRDDYPNNAVPSLLLGQLAFWRGNFADAKQNFNTAAVIDPGDEMARNWLNAVKKVETGIK